MQVDVRLVAATNQDLRAAVAARRFREDLYFRLSVFPITVPPLRERPGDIPVLARFFVDRFCRDLKKKSWVLSPPALEQLQAYRWPVPGGHRDGRNNSGTPCRRAAGREPESFVDRQLEHLAAGAAQQEMLSVVVDAYKP